MPTEPGSDPVPLSALNQYLYCTRRAALIHIEGIFVDNEHTLLGNLAHEHADLQGYETVAGAKILRALPVFSRQLGLNGICDIVEKRADGTLYPVEYKKGRRRKFDNDDAQLCAQALCLEEMFQTCIPFGAIFHASSKRRREVAFTQALRDFTIEACQRLQHLLRAGWIPEAILQPRCEGCSLHSACMPEMAERKKVYLRAYKDLFIVDS